MLRSMLELYDYNITQLILGLCDYGITIAFFLRYIPCQIFSSINVTLFIV